ncbi:23S rRNA (pseudouridine(1915)-N(3))-methyltransferase RlmH [Heliobacterium undosum]|uniref:Ribosomal RNA large subunit methyltransferase H n=1 Tax=Heliomicrobium undosum TaxID=121734 RepID=A0A845L412_9FIRM|nr:23S rRNA (pseudouridine(1915)-N(3))-methyltransferase RlmH [Heliomicrobium undosum]MZP29584.1 23S rRNA (pseudouridine(1915)-N(3))-methyltransferase RlmH [Heliomicrobium undosum]
MLHIRIVAVGKLKEKYLKEGLQEYTKRLGAYSRLEIIEVPDEKVPDKPSDTEAEIIKRKEGDRLLATAGEKDFIGVALDPRGEMWSTEDLAEQMRGWELYGPNLVVFFIGGTLGLSKEVHAACKAKWSLSRLTFPHQLVRLILLEQVYRGFKVNRGETYHR